MKPEKFIADFLKKHADDIYHMPSDWEIHCEVKRTKECCGNDEERQKRGAIAYIECDDGGAACTDPAKRRSREDRMCALFRIYRPKHFWKAEFMTFVNPKEAGE